MSRVYEMRGEDGPLPHFYQAPSEQDAINAAEEDGYVVVSADEIIPGMRFEFTEIDYIGALRTAPEPEIPVPGNCATDPQTVDDNGPEETERDRAASLGPDHDRLTLALEDAGEDGNSFGMDIWDEVLSPEEYLQQARRDFDWPEKITWVIVTDDWERNGTATVTFIAPRGALAGTVVAEYQR
jgi:hypothetical protein